MFQEFPKGLLKGEEVRIVFDIDEETAARAEGWRFHSDEEEKQDEPKKRGRPRKVEA